MTEADNQSLPRLQFNPADGAITNETQAENLRGLACVIEEALRSCREGVTMNPVCARMVRTALFDLADRIELD